MRVARLEVFGFKSFLDRLVLPLGSGITGVVGPNGCGKSNIVDALRWILGETRASHLRGGVLEDVIFNGTDTLRPLGLAEVTLTLRSTESGFFDDLRSSLKHVAGDSLPPADAPTADSCERTPETPEQPASGEAELQTEAVPEEIEQVLDEVEAQSRPRLTVIEGALSEKASEQAAAESSAPPVEEPISTAPPEQATLTRFAWLKTVEEVQITRRLYRSGESEFFINRVACRLKDIKELLRAVGLSTRAYTIVAQGEVSRIVTAKPEERRLILEEAAGVSGFRERIASATRRLEETGINLTRLEDVIKEVTRQVNSLRVQASRARNRQQLKERISFLEKALFEDGYRRLLAKKDAESAQTAQARQAEGELDANFQKVYAEEQELRGASLGADVEGDELRAKMDAIREELDKRRRERQSLSAGIVQLKAQMEAIRTEYGSLGERRAVLDARSDESAKEITGLETQDAELAAAIDRLGSGSDDELRSIATELGHLRTNLRNLEQSIAKIREDRVAIESRKRALDEQLEAASPINQLERIVSGEGESRDLATRLAQEAELFAQTISAPSQYTKALQSILAEKAAFIVSKDASTLARTYSRESGRGLGVFSAAVEAPDAAAAPELGGVPFPALLSLIEVSPGSRQAARELLANVFVCENREAGLQYFEAGGRPVTLATLDGEILTHFSFYALPQSRGLIEVKREAIDLIEQIKTFDSREQELQAERQAIQERVSAAEQRQTEALAESQRRQAQARELANQQGDVRGRLHAARRFHNQVVQDLQKLSEQGTILEARLADAERACADAEARLAASNPEDDELLEQELSIVRDRYSEVDEVRKEARTKIARAAQASHYAREALDRARETVQQRELELQKTELEIQSLMERVITEYGMEILQACEESIARGESFVALEEPQRIEYREEAQKLRGRIAREGEVDSTSIERYEEEQKRLEDLEKQKRDLESAVHTLKATVEQLTQTSEKRFLTTFAVVRQNFSKLVPRLFGGGKASLELIDPTSPLETGVEIIVRPPGKRLKSIDLLSGGEKALCAIALIFAMFLYRPSPLCVLDEVDAPLDEANLMRYLSLVKDMSQKTQFLMVTHNKQSMALADQLIGVTMPQPGASRIISVSLQEAFAHVA